MALIEFKTKKVAVTILPHEAI